MREDVAGLLRELGMQEYETKAYLTLLEGGVCTAEDVSNGAGIPLTRVYETLSALEKRGLIAVVNTRPKKYKVASLKDLEVLVEEKRDKMRSELERAEGILKKIHEVAPRPNGKHRDGQHSEDIWIVRGRKNSVREIKEATRKAKKSILIFAEDITWLPEFRPVLLDRIRSGVGVRILCHVNDRTMKRVKAALGMGAEIRNWEMRGLKGSILDGRIAHLVCKTPKPGVKEEAYYGMPGNDTLFAYETITMHNPVLIRVFKTYFDSFWKTGKDPGMA
ncbi:MAG: TrmB family transcriptional regulator [Candidatus Aenigmarchaeota archaeon]|nr:TrmB family transcriptional regulator [Candidatus Aenigmarchaeota archaeon]